MNLVAERRPLPSPLLRREGRCLALGPTAAVRNRTSSSSSSTAQAGAGSTRATERHACRRRDVCKVDFNENLEEISPSIFKVLLRAASTVQVVRLIDHFFWFPGDAETELSKNARGCDAHSTLLPSIKEKYSVLPSPEGMIKGSPNPL